MVATKLMTADELAALPDERHCELIEGELVDMSPAGPSQGKISGRLVKQLSRYLDHHEIGFLWVGDTGYVMETNPDTVLAPDLAVVTTEADQSIGLDERGFTPFVPLLAIEIKSSSDREAEITRRLGIYQRAGVTEVWWLRLADRTLSMHWLDRAPASFTAPAIVTASVVLPGLELDLGQVFS